MEARFDYLGKASAGKFFKHLVSAGRTLVDSPLSITTQELVRMRASQINGCGSCLDIHTKEAAAAGESAVRINLVATWREATVFTDAERAALELAEQGTRLADTPGGVTDDAWANAAKHYDDAQLADLISVIAVINAFNRINVIARRPGGDYEAGQLS
ncbi:MULTISPECIES: carboxymuconolactone decarboxylase family protein [Streptomyces]|uniref:carboxymuconolactone decarboxylase family protein n=1 Tax=Streptomyces TaxID=1883 RepID=UPI001E514EE9|nr:MULTISPECIES: carboxymuconolactone decarboxylase family protein [Streptomyces]UFQ19806.1 carboxymuconolactone decarboxylase family protein [Streptomyces huasconensis]WCL89429.1 carboxymuconolactone decarboxylase family protein [Streptomyces sp. JCM 35825]